MDLLLFDSILIDNYYYTYSESNVYLRRIYLNIKLFKLDFEKRHSFKVKLHCQLRRY